MSGVTLAETRTAVDETHRDVELGQIELAPIVNVGESPARPHEYELREHKMAATHHIFARSFLSSPLCPNTSSAVCPLMKPVPCWSQARKIWS